MSLVLVSDVRKRAYRENNIEGFDLTYNLEFKDGAVDQLNCNGSKQNTPTPEGQPTMPTSVNFNYIAGNPSISSNVFNGILTETLQQHVKDQFDLIIASVENGDPVITE